MVCQPSRAPGVWSAIGLLDAEMEHDEAAALEFDAQMAHVRAVAADA